MADGLTVLRRGELSLADSPPPFPSTGGSNCSAAGLRGVN